MNNIGKLLDRLHEIPEPVLTAAEEIENEEWELRGDTTTLAEIVEAQADALIAIAAGRAAVVWEEYRPREGEPEGWGWAAKMLTEDVDFLEAATALGVL